LSLGLFDTTGNATTWACRRGTTPNIAKTVDCGNFSAGDFLVRARLTSPGGKNRGASPLPRRALPTTSWTRRFCVQEVGGGRCARERNICADFPNRQKTSFVRATPVATRPLTPSNPACRINNRTRDPSCEGQDAVTRSSARHNELRAVKQMLSSCRTLPSVTLRAWASSTARRAGFGSGLAMCTQPSVCPAVGAPRRHLSSSSSHGGKSTSSSSPSSSVGSDAPTPTTSGGITAAQLKHFAEATYFQLLGV
jgi:hypothetical protein